MPAKMPKQSTNEIATTEAGRDITRGYIDALPYIQPDDRILRLGGSSNYELYEEVLRDDQVHAVFSQRRLAVVARPAKVMAGGHRRMDKMAASFIEEMLAHVRFDTVTDRMLYGRFYGYAVAEALWMRDGAHVVLDQLKVRNRRRFVFAPDFRLKLVTTDNPDGEALPDKKFWCLATGADHDDEPYGLGLAHWLYWPVYFKRNQTKFWLIFLEKFGQPTAIGKYPRNADEKQKETLLSAMQSIRTDASIAMPKDVEIELLEAARSGTVDYAALFDRMNAAISKVVVGQTMTTDDGASKSQASVHMDVRGDIVKADARLICDSFNRSIVRWLTDWNFPGAAYPQVVREMEEAPDLKAQAERDEIIIRMMGAKPDKNYIEEVYGLTLAETSAPMNPEETSLAETESSAGALEQALDAMDAEDWQALADPLIKPVLAQAKADPGALMDDLASLYPALNTEALEQQLARLIFVADIVGRTTEHA